MEEKYRMKPTRRAARLAAQKIFNTVHMYGLDEPSKPEKEYFPPGGHFSSSEHTGLLMECCEEILSGVQREAFYKAKQAYEEANQKIIYLKSLNAKIINSLDGDFQLDSELNEINYGMDSKIGQKFLENNSSIAIHPVINIKQVQQQTITITTGVDNNSMPEVLPITNPSSYKVYDSRTGAIVGTLPGDTTIVSQDGVHISSALEPITILKVDTDKQISLPNSVIHQEKSNKNASESKNSLQKTLTIVSGGHKMVTTCNLLAVRVKSVSSSSKLQQIKELKNSLDQEHYREDAIQWMIKKKILPNQIQCKWCSLSSLNLIVDKSFIDGYVWKCNNLKCRKTILVNRLPFFGRFGISMSKLLALTYHWAIQTDIAEVMKDVEVNVYTVRSVWRMLQEVCGVSVALKSSKLGGTNCSVEFGIAQLGRFLIVGVYDRRTGLTRMKVMSVAIGLNTSVFLKTIEPWLHKKSLVISNDAKLSKLSTIGLQHVLVKSSSSEAAIHTDNITDYLRKQLSSLFGEFAVNQLKIDTIQGFLDELQWRERFDTSPKECFWNILKHITDKTGNQGSAFELEQINSSPVSNSNQRAVLKRTLNDEDNESNKKQKVNGVDVILDEYYYARLEPQISVIEKNKDKVYQFKCQLCKKYIDNNIKVMKHMNGHIENSRQKNLDLGDLTQCKYCYRKFETPYSMQCHIEAIHFQSNALACRICNQAFSEVVLLVNHMKMIHCQTEMPYACSICKYRSSFHSDVLEHFQQCHNGSDEIMCHYCLKIFQIKFSVRGLGYIQNFYDHLHKHQCKSSSKNCPSCCLTFLNIQDLRIHKLYDHQSMKSVSGVVPIKSSSAEPIIVTDPHIKPSNNTNCDIIIDNEEINRSKSVNTSVLYHSSKSISLALSIANEMIGALCFECKNIIEKDHFKKFSVCVICHYSTNCNKAFMNHLVNHECNSEKLQIKSSFNFSCPMFCICGFSHVNGDIIAAHLSYCKKNSCYCSKQDVLSTNIKTETAAEYFDCPSAFFPPLVVLDEDEEESINESFAKLSASNILFEEEEKILPIDESIFEDQILKEEKDDRPNMLNALGLVRKKSALPPGILTVNDENIEDTILSLGSDLSQYKSPVTKSDDDNHSIELSTENLTDDQETVMDINLNNIEINNKPQIQQTEENIVKS